MCLKSLLLQLIEYRHNIYGNEYVDEESKDGNGEAEPSLSSKQDDNVLHMDGSGIDPSVPIVSQICIC
jgi:hypothetical protein